MSALIPPGATIGVLGSGQLGRMFAIAARRMGYRVHTFSPESDTPTGQVSDLEITGDYLDQDAIRRFAQAVDVVTFEFENVPARTAQWVSELAPVRPDGSALHVAQNRVREKSFLSRYGIPTAEHRTVASKEELVSAINDLGLPGILKTAGFGYDGKGQVRLESAHQAEAAFERLGLAECVLEAIVDFEFEMSVIAARDQHGMFAHWGCIENAHVRHILDVSTAPANMPGRTEQDAVEIAREILDLLEYVGVMGIEYFVCRDGRLLVNELAPRPHNSGHLTIDAAATCQFEQQVRAVCGLPLGSTRMHRAAAMANLLGDLWPSVRPTASTSARGSTTGEANGGSLHWDAALALPEVKLHLYGKQEPRIGRKMGHLTALAESPAAARKSVLEARRRLCEG